MKKVFGIIVGLLVLGSTASLIFACAAPGRRVETGRPSLLDEYRDGVYEGTAQGRRGPIRLAVCLESGVISEIDIIDFRDDEFVGGSAVDELMEQILEYNTTDLDAITGATESSLGFLAAVEDALTKAKISGP
ncbi:MAG: FMN-binding protein [Treponema sp.]|jgi:uncharacterized protein with FMN-binding domain|nr:FMN-binding protein [Treponema sp.]